MQNGYGKPIANLTPDQISANAKYLIFAEMFNFADLFFMRTSVCFFTKRILSKADRWPLYLIYLAWFFNLISTLANMVGFGIQCRPFQGLWDKSVKPQCFDESTFQDVFLAATSLSVVSDFMVVAVPMAALHPRQMTSSVKVGVFAILSLSFATAGLGIGKCIVFPNIHDPYYDSVPVQILSLVEENHGIILASVPALRQLYLLFNNRLAANGASRPALDSEGGWRGPKSVPRKPMDIMSPKSNHSSGIFGHAVADRKVRRNFEIHSKLHEYAGNGSGNLDGVSRPGGFVSLENIHTVRPVMIGNDFHMLSSIDPNSASCVSLDKPPPYSSAAVRREGQVPGQWVPPLPSTTTADDSPYNFFGMRKEDIPVTPPDDTNPMDDPPFSTPITHKDDRSVAPIITTTQLDDKGSTKQSSTSVDDTSPISPTSASTDGAEEPDPELSPVGSSRYPSYTTLPTSVRLSKVMPTALTVVPDSGETTPRARESPPPLPKLPPLTIPQPPERPLREPVQKSSNAQMALHPAMRRKRSASHGDHPRARPPVHPNLPTMHKDDDPLPQSAAPRIENRSNQMSKRSYERLAHQETHNRPEIRRTRKDSFSTSPPRRQQSQEHIRSRQQSQEHSRTRNHSREHSRPRQQSQETVRPRQRSHERSRSRHNSQDRSRSRQKIATQIKKRTSRSADSIQHYRNKISSAVSNMTMKNSGGWLIPETPALPSDESKISKTYDNMVGVTRQAQAMQAPTRPPRSPLMPPEMRDDAPGPKVPPKSSSKSPTNTRPKNPPIRTSSLPQKLMSKYNRRDAPTSVEETSQAQQSNDPKRSKTAAPAPKDHVVSKQNPNTTGPEKQAGVSQDVRDMSAARHLPSSQPTARSVSATGQAVKANQNNAEPPLPGIQPSATQVDDEDDDIPPPPPPKRKPTLGDLIKKHTRTDSSSTTSTKLSGFMQSFTEAVTLKERAVVEEGEQAGSMGQEKDEPRAQKQGSSAPTSAKENSNPKVSKDASPAPVPQKEAQKPGERKHATADLPAVEKTTPKANKVDATATNAERKPIQKPTKAQALARAMEEKAAAKPDVADTQSSSANKIVPKAGLKSILKPVPEKKTEVKPASEHKIATGQVVGTTTVQKKPIESTPLEGKSPEKKPVEGRPTDNRPVMHRKPVAESKVETKPAAQSKLEGAKSTPEGISNATNTTISKPVIDDQILPMTSLQSNPTPKPREITATMKNTQAALKPIAEHTLAQSSSQETIKLIGAPKSTTEEKIVPKTGMKGILKPVTEDTPTLKAKGPLTSNAVEEATPMPVKPPPAKRRGNSWMKQPAGASSTIKAPPAANPALRASRALSPTPKQVNSVKDMVNKLNAGK